MDVLFLVVDSLRGHPFADGRVARTPFLNSLASRALSFSRAYATECWTLPSHASMFTGLMPSEHGAHFHSMAYAQAAPTLAEVLGGRGYHTECFTRNAVLDGTIPGVVRGFARRTTVLHEAAGLDPTALFLALAKPRFRRHLRETGFFHPRQSDSRRFAATFARALRPADEPLLERVALRMAALRAESQRFFLFANLYDVHAPYPPSDDSLLLPWQSVAGVRENLMAPYALSRLGRHRYLQRGFRVSEAVRTMLERRYRRAAELMDGKLQRFFAELGTRGLLDDTLVVLASDHGEGFGEHGLYLHDGSLYESHLKVPLWVLAPNGPCGAVADVVSTRHLFGLIEHVTGVGSMSDTIVDAEFRARHPVALAQHYHYQHVRDPLPVYRSNQFAAVGKTHKILVRGGEALLYDLRADADELHPQRIEWREGIDLLSDGDGGAADGIDRYRAAVA